VDLKKFFIFSAFCFFTAAANQVAAKAICESNSFYFASNSDLIAERLQQADCAKNPTLFGFDPYHAPKSSESPEEGLRLVKRRIALAKQKGCKTHIYLEGPKGPTGSTWNEKEKQRYEAARANHSNWYTTGWWEHTKTEILKFQDHYSVEIDNLQRVEDIRYDKEGYRKFLTKFCEFKSENEKLTGMPMPKLTAKNVSRDQMKVVAEFAANPTTQNCISEFAISEAGSNQVGSEARKAGIAVYRAPKFIDTYNYRAMIPRHASCHRPPVRGLATAAPAILSDSAQQELSTP